MPIIFAKLTKKHDLSIPCPKVFRQENDYFSTCMRGRGRFTLQKVIWQISGGRAAGSRMSDTIEFLGIWDGLYNRDFIPLKFEGFSREAGLNAFTLSPKSDYWKFG